jgi:hypothetical protein
VSFPMEYMESSKILTNLQVAAPRLLGASELQGKSGRSGVASWIPSPYGERSINIDRYIDN